MIRRPPRSTLDRSSAASDVYKRQTLGNLGCYAPGSGSSVACRAGSGLTNTGPLSLRPGVYAMEAPSAWFSSTSTAYFAMDNGFRGQTFPFLRDATISLPPTYGVL